MTQCPCGTGQPYAECCEPVIKKEREAGTAEELMRSRYSAYVRTEVGHLKDTTHPDNRGEFDEKGARDWSRKADWDRLEIVDTRKGGAEDDYGQVEFVAHFRQKGERIRHHELAEFKKLDDRWFFYDGQPVVPHTYKRDMPKVGRNDPCPCGSGKKFKKCCAT
ncbi:MAG: YchJ family protein [Desulfatibacillaceae bacterium]